MGTQRRILAIISYPFLPATTGGEISTLNILNFMGKKMPLTVFTVEPYKPVDKNSFSFELIFGMPFKAWRYLNPFYLIAIHKLIKSKNCNTIFFDQPWMGWMIPILRFVFGKQVFIRSNNIEYLRFKSMNKSWWSVLYMYEKLAYLSANLVIFVSDIDQNKAIVEFGLSPDKTLLTPYGVPHNQLPTKVLNAREILLNRYRIDAEAKLFLFFATLSYKPNAEAVELICGPLLEQLRLRFGNFKILICGKNLDDEIQKQINTLPEVIYCGFVEDIETYIDGVDAMFNPIVSGGGIKTKAVDTLARGQRVISTRTGAEGIASDYCGNCLQIVEDFDWEGFADQVVYSINGAAPELPNRFFERYSWPGIIQVLQDKLAQLQ
ncbi:MAG: glycosyltransferase [Bacteroidetes bacterium]|nr:glycosyltransferase [Bacteroidota bacterium]